jgi:hypothetical protein
MRLIAKFAVVMKSKERHRHNTSASPNRNLRHFTQFHVLKIYARKSSLKDSQYNLKGILQILWGSETQEF